MDKKYLKNFFLGLGSLLLSAGFIYYLLYHFTNGFSSKITTVPADMITEDITLSSEACIFRDEEVVYSRYNGFIVYNAADGERVGAEAKLAEVYSTADVSGMRHRVLAIEAQIKLLEASGLPAGVVISDTKQLDRGIKESFLAVRKRAEDGDITALLDEKDNLLIQLNKRQIIKNDISGFNPQINRLTETKNSLLSQLQGTSEQLSSTRSGYFFYETDGLESIFTYDKLSSLTPALLADMTAQTPLSVNSQGNYGVGKMVYDYRWSIAVPVGSRDAEYFTEGKNYDIIFPYNNDCTVSMRLDRVIGDTNGGSTALLVFSTGIMPEGFNYERTQTVRIIRGRAEGYAVPAESVRIADGVTGVYTLYGSGIKFKQINILLECDGYYIAEDIELIKKREGETADESAVSAASDVPFLERFDEIITSGKDLYDGKIIR